MKGNKGEDDETRCNAMETSQIRELIRIHYFKSLKCIRNVYTYMNGERREGERVNQIGREKTQRKSMRTGVYTTAIGCFTSFMDCSDSKCEKIFVFR